MINLSEEELFGLSHSTIQSLREIFSKWPQIEKVIIYGSRAKGNHKTGSDIDLILVAPTLSITDCLKIENQIDDLSL